MSEINALARFSTRTFWKTVSAVQLRLVLEKADVVSDIAQDSICQAMSAPPRLGFRHASGGSEERKQCPQFHIVAAVSCCCYTPFWWFPIFMVPTTNRPRFFLEQVDHAKTDGNRLLSISQRTVLTTIGMHLEGSHVYAEFRSA